MKDGSNFTQKPGKSSHAGKHMLSSKRAFPNRSCKIKKG